MEKIFTIGYEGKTPDEFLKVLKEAEISIVVDVRENPASRKKGFSKKILSATLNDNGIQYRHIAELGTPKDIRVEYQNSGNLERLLEQYRAYLTENTVHINTLLDAIGNNTACIMCFEKLASQCHRLVITEYLYLNHEVAINHL